MSVTQVERVFGRDAVKKKMEPYFADESILNFAFEDEIDKQRFALGYIINNGKYEPLIPIVKEFLLTSKDYCIKRFFYCTCQ